ncbi:MAG: tRNA (adenosine(37)-N6)-threonylcarbamoyltransferase complex dimerization subunit type 1 TsaB [Lachnospiraceae bacterium]|nr:tRNA (adenosine(37)-N6)-threonylcarbamoyltransferase complex dimerization subunit type 1 TsaB [Lachnospiraceae bacterium]
MKILAIDSSGQVATVALTSDGTVLAEYTVNYKKTHSQTLLPMIDEAVRMTEFDLKQIDCIAIAAGPGSFTGLRIGSATAKGLAMALDKPIVEIPTVDALAFNLWGCEKIICPMMDARRQQVYTGLYTFEGGELKTLLPQCAIAVTEVIDKINETGLPVVFLGDGVPVYEEIIKTGCKVSYLIAPAHQNRQNALSVASLGEVYFNKGLITPCDEHKPIYLRKSQAEREKGV